MHRVTFSSSNGRNAFHNICWVVRSIELFYNKISICISATHACDFHLMKKIKNKQENIGEKKY